jgi:hypothetical protein
VTLVEMGFEVAAARRALLQSHGDIDAAAALLVEGGGDGGGGGAAEEAGSSVGGKARQAEEVKPKDKEDVEEEEDEDKEGESDSDSDGNGDGDSDEARDEGEEDVEMEAELVGGVASGDALKEYDIELTLEGEAIAEFLALVSHGAPAAAEPA